VSTARDLTKLYQAVRSDFSRVKARLDELDLWAAEYWRLSSDKLASCVDSVQAIEARQSRVPSAEATDHELLSIFTDVVTESDSE
jgi:hypothetical protein